MKVSIVIPTFNHCDDLLAPCIESILKYTDLNDTEIIVVANGCTDNTAEYLKDKPVKIVWFEKGLGYTKATNAGIKVSTGQYVVLLNNDTELLPQPKNAWIDILLDPFKNAQVGITGPMMIPCMHTGKKFLIFFCVCIKREIFNKIGILDEIFSPGYGEDTDFCIRAQNAGYGLYQVCSDAQFGPDPHGTNKQMVGQFPIYHKGNKTLQFVPNGDSIITRNTKVLQERYGPITVRPLVYNCFSFNTELDLLEMRFAALFDVVDRFVISEGNKTFGNKPKPYHFKDNLGRFAKYLSKVTHFMVDDWPDLNPWSMEHYQRDQCMRALTGCSDNDIIVITDADEIPTAEAIRGYKPGDDVQALEMDLYYYDLDTKAEDHKWKQPRIVTYGILKKSNFWDIIYGPANGVIPNAGKHLCYFGGLSSIIRKIEDSAHQELNTPEMKDPEKIKRAIAEGKDLFGRPDVVFVKSGTVKYNLGCGDDVKPGFVNVDLHDPHADVKWDLTQDWNFAANDSVDLVFASNIFEHLPDKMHTMNELYKILKVGGRAEIHLPSTDGRGAFQDPTHVSFWNANSWVYWCNDNPKLLLATQRCGFKGAFKMISLNEEKQPFGIIMTKVIIEKVAI